MGVRITFLSPIRYQIKMLRNFIPEMTTLNNNKLPK